MSHTTATPVTATVVAVDGEAPEYHEQGQQGKEQRQGLGAALAGFAGADYTFTNGEVFVIWILMAILVNNCFKK